MAYTTRSRASLVAELEPHAPEPTLQEQIDLLREQVRSAQTWVAHFEELKQKGTPKVYLDFITRTQIKIEKLQFALDWDITPMPDDMPIIDLEAAKEIPYDPIP